MFLKQANCYIINILGNDLITKTSSKFNKIVLASKALKFTKLTHNTQ